MMHTATSTVIHAGFELEKIRLTWQTRLADAQMLLTIVQKRSAGLFQSKLGVNDNAVDGIGFIPSHDQSSSSSQAKRRRDGSLGALLELCIVGAGLLHLFVSLCEEAAWWVFA